jgi:hypothetical protein
VLLDPTGTAKVTSCCACVSTTDGPAVKVPLVTVFTNVHPKPSAVRTRRNVNTKSHADAHGESQRDCDSNGDVYADSDTDGNCDSDCDCDVPAVGGTTKPLLYERGSARAAPR